MQDCTPHKGFTSTSTVHHCPVTPDKTNKLSEDWRKLVGNTYLSDVNIQCDQDEIIPAHKLVLYVRCPALLQVTTKQDNDKDVILLNDCTKLSALAFLEFVYCGNSRKILDLSSQEFQTLINLTEIYNFSELKNELLLVDKTRKNQEKMLVGKYLRADLFGDCSDGFDDENDRQFNVNRRCGVSTENDHQFIENEEIDFQKCDFKIADFSSSQNGARSPDMFGDSSILDKKSYSPEKDDLAILASLLGKTYDQANDIDKNVSSPVDDIESMNSLSLSGSASVKRKALNSSLGEDEDIANCKRACTDLQQSATSEETTKYEEICDLTQSSCSSKDDSSVKNQFKFEGDRDDCEIVISAENLDESLEELTQLKSPSPTLTQNLSQTKDAEADSFNNVCPVGNGFDDDCWYYNYIDNTPIKNSSFQKCSDTSVTKSGNRTVSLSPKYLYSGSNSPDKNFLNISNPSSSVSSIKNILPTEGRLSERCSKIPVETSVLIYEKGIKKKGSSSHSVDNTDVDLSKDNSKHFKSCRNLSFQFDTRNDFEFCGKQSSSKLENQEESPANETTSTASNTEEGKVLKKSYKKDSLHALQRLLDDSFEINESRFPSIDALSYTPVDKEKITEECTSTSPPKHGNVAMTPLPEICVSDTVTPLPNYSSMKTPALKVRV